MSQNSMLVSLIELKKHNSSSSCWIAIKGTVYDVTEFLSQHPGGEGPIMRVAGTDATADFSLIHSVDILSTLPEKSVVGQLDHQETSLEVLDGEIEYQRRRKDLPDLESLLNLHDFEHLAQQVMEKGGWDYYSSGGDDEITLRENHLAFQRLWLRPRVLVDVSNISVSTTILGSPSSLPIYVTACALGKLAHPNGETNLTRAAGTRGIIQMMPTLASCSLNEMTEALVSEQPFFYQLYVNRNREVTKQIVQRVEQLGCKGLFVTVDAPVLGRREKDMRNKFSAIEPSVQRGDKVQRNAGAARAISGFIDPSLNWKDIEWFKTFVKIPIVIKGIQCAEDALLAVQYGVQGIVISNHGGRQLDFSRSSIEVLLEVMEALKAIRAEKKLEIFIDGGIRRGSDVFKALALGAKAVGIGRPFLYAMATYGQEGVERAIDIVRDEFEMVMKLMGSPTLDDITPSMICTRNIGHHFALQPADFLSQQVYVPMSPATLKSRL